MNKIEYVVYAEISEIENMKKSWGECNIAELPHIHRYKRNKHWWEDGEPPVKVKVTI